MRGVGVLRRLFSAVRHEDSVRETTVTLPDGAEIDVAQNPESAILVATGITASVSEKVSTGDYENVEVFASIRGELRPAMPLLFDEDVDALAERVAEAQTAGQRAIDEAVVAHPATDDQPGWRGEAGAD